jgi:hypothetical protein
MFGMGLLDMTTHRGGAWASKTHVYCAPADMVRARQRNLNAREAKRAIDFIGRNKPSYAVSSEYGGIAEVEV